VSQSRNTHFHTVLTQSYFDDQLIISNATRKVCLPKETKHWSQLTSLKSRNSSIKFMTKHHSFHRLFLIGFALDTINPQAKNAQ